MTGKENATLAGCGLQLSCRTVVEQWVPGLVSGEADPDLMRQAAEKLLQLSIKYQ